MRSKILLFLLLGSPLVSAEDLRGCDLKVNEKIQQYYHDIVKSGDHVSQELIMQKLLVYVQGLAADQISQVDETSIADLSELLKVDGEVGKFYAARSLRLMKCRARSALPHLRAAMKGVEIEAPKSDQVVLGKSVSPTEEVVRAIAEIEKFDGC